jgi:hypothetical protein
MNTESSFEEGVASSYRCSVLRQRRGRLAARAQQGERMRRIFMMTKGIIVAVAALMLALTTQSARLRCN